MVQAEKDARLRHQEYLELAEMAVPEVVIAEKDREAAEQKEAPNA